MPRATWLLEHDCPVVQIQLKDLRSGSAVTRRLIADTGAGDRFSPSELILRAGDCQHYLGARSGASVRLGGAIAGTYPTYSMWVEISPLRLARWITVVAVPAAAIPAGFDGIAGFRFLNSFHYGNFGNPNQFGLETF